jgi:hypothetical protein
MAARSIPCSAAAEEPTPPLGECLAEASTFHVHAARGQENIYCPTDGALFNLVDDPNELNNMAESHP